MKKAADVIKESIRKILGIMVHDLKKIFTNPIAAIVAVGVLILPSLYAWFNIRASWDPYGSTNNLAVAVASVDEGTTVQGMELNIGDSIIESLTGNDQIGWKFTDQDEAVAGVKSGKYYAAVVIPEDFSQDMTSVLRKDITRPQIEYYVNEKKNAIAPKITDKGAGAIQQQVNETFISQVVTVMGETMMKIAEGVSEAEGKIDEKLFENVSLSDNILSVEHAIETMKNLNVSIDSLVGTIDAFGETSEALDSLVESLRTTIQITDESLSELRDSQEDFRKSESLEHISGATPGVYDTVLDGVNNNLDNLISRLEVLEKNLDEDSQSALAALSAMKNQIAGIKNINSGLIDILKGNSLLYSLQGVKELVGKLEEANTSLTKAESSIDRAIQLLNEDKDASESVRQLRDELNEAANAMHTALEGYRNLVRGEMEGIVSDMNGKLAAIRSELASVKSLAPIADNTIKSAGTAMDSLGSSMDSVAEVLKSSKELVSSGITSLENVKEVLKKVQEGSEKSLVDSLKKFLLEKFGVDLDEYDNTPEAIGSFLSSPVELNTEKVYPIANYGSALSPFYSILAMWVGGLVLVSILKCKAKDDETLAVSKYRPFELYMGRYLIFMIFAILQSVIICLGDLYWLKIQCLHPGLYIFVGVVAGIVFSNVIYTLTITFGDVGKAVAVVLLVLQVAGAGGTFPIEVTPGFFNKINPFLPFTHGMNAMREAIAGFYGNTYIVSLLKLFVYFPIFFLFGTVFRTPLIKLNNFFEEHLEDTGIM